VLNLGSTEGPQEWLQSGFWYNFHKSYAL